jgi:radical SAM superfamily enzyme YgiQ (UPF0313 family)
MNNMHFLLFRIPINFENPRYTTLGYEAISYPPLGLMYIASSLENNDHIVDFIDLDFESLSSEDLERKLSNTDVVGLEVYTYNTEEVGILARKIKELNPKIPIIIGGPHCMFFKEKSLLDIEYADIAVIGEGEETIVDISLYLQGNKKLSDIYNIAYRKDGKIFQGKGFKILRNLDDLSFPARHLVEKYDYDVTPRGIFYKKRLTLMMTSRGCRSNCLFCSRYTNSYENYGFRQRSAENVVDEILSIDKKYHSVMIVDDCYLLDIKRSHKIFDMLIEKKSEIDILIMGARVDSADEELYKKMKKANVTFIGFGIESGNQDVLDFYNKKVNLNQIRKAVYLARKMGFQTAGTLIFGAPIETKEHFKKTINFSKSLPLDIAIFNILIYKMGSPLWNKAVKNNKIKKDEFFVLSDSHRDLGNFTSEELYRYSRKAYYGFYMRPSYIISRVKECFIRRNFDPLKKASKLFSSIK